MKRGCCLLAGVLIVVFLAACGGGGETETSDTAETASTKYSSQSPPPEILVTLDGYMGPENAGLLVAEEKGYYDDLGLNVSLRSPVEPRRPVTYVADRTDDIGVAQMPQVVFAKEKRAPIVAVGSVIPRPTAAFIWLPESGIQSIADLSGKTIVTPGIPAQEAFLETVLRREGLTLEDVKIKHARFNLAPTLLRGRADAIFGGTWNLEGAALGAAGAEPVVTRLSDLGVPAYEELVILVRTDTLAKEPKMVRDFMSATLRGTRFAVDHPKAAVKAVMKGYERNFKVTREEVEAQLKATLPLFSKSGRMDPAQTDDLVKWMQAQGQIKRRIPASDLLTNAYLPQP